MQHLEGSGTPVLYIGRTVLKGYVLFILICLSIGAKTVSVPHTLIDSLIFIILISDFISSRLHHSQVSNTNPKDYPIQQEFLKFS